MILQVFPSSNLFVQECILALLEAGAKSDESFGEFRPKKDPGKVP